MYSTVEDIKRLVPEETLLDLTDDEGMATVNQARVEEAIVQADAEIEGYLGGRYSVPLSPVPEVVRKLSVEIAVYNLFSRRVVLEVPEVRKDSYRNAVRLLEGIAKGTISLGADPAPKAPSDSGAETNKAVDENVFSREKLKGF